MKTRITALVLCFLILSACVPAVPQATKTSTPLQSNTAISTVTLSSSQTPTPSPTENIYTYSKEKLFNPIPSYEFLQAHPEKVAWAPFDPWIEPDKFNQWLKGDLTTDLGDLSRLEYSVSMVDTGHEINEFYDSEAFGIPIDKKHAPYLTQPIVFGVRHNGVEYPVVVVTIKGSMGESLGTHAVLLYNGSIEGMRNNEGFGSLKILFDKSKNVRFLLMLRGSKAYPSIPDEINQLTALGYDAFANQFPHIGVVETIAFGPGFFDFFETN